MIRYKSIYLYTGEEMESALRKLFGLLELFPETKNAWFFIRYADEKGPHIRYRVNERYAPLLFPVVKTNFPDHVETDYIPETERYGGMENLSNCEHFFNFSSNLVNAIYHQFDTLAYDNRLLFALAVNKLMYTVNFPDNPNASILAFREQWLQHNSSITQLPPSFFLEEYERRSTTLFPGIVNQIDLLTSFIDDLVENKNVFKPKLSEVSNLEKVSIINSLVHMSNNRLGIANIDEPFLADLTCKIIQFESPHSA